MSMPTYQPNKRSAETACAEPGDVPKPEDLDGVSDMNASKRFKAQFNKGASPEGPKVGVVNNRG